MVLSQYGNIGNLCNLVRVHDLYVRKVEEVNEAQTEDEEIPASSVVSQGEEITMV